MPIKIGRVERYIYERLDEKGAMLFMLIDPVDYKSPERAIKAGVESIEGGADLLLVGGSIGAQGELLEQVTKGIKDRTHDVPIVLFPGNIATITRYADAFYFLSVLNARNPYWITQVQMLGAPLLKQMKIEPLPVGYIVVEPGGTVGWVADVNLVPRAKPRIAAALANAGEYMGHRFIITDAGSNPQLQNSGPIPAEMIRAVKSAITVPYIVGGGVTDAGKLGAAYKAGADIVQIGAILERVENPKKHVELFADVTKEEGRKKKH